MSIASELNNYRNGLEDAYDAVNDMSGTIPTDRNMNNLDDAIRTIPISSPNDGVLTITQNSTTLGTFSANQATNTTVNITTPTTTTFYWDYDSGTATLNLYKQTSPTYVVATDSDVMTAFSNGVLFIRDDDSPFSDNLTYVMTSWDDDCYRLGAVSTKEDYTNTTIPYYIGMVWDGATQTWTRDVSRLTYTAGTNVSIDAQNVISATDTTYSDFTGATASVAGAHGLVPAPAAGDQGKALHGDGTWKDTTAKLVEMAYGESNAWAKFIAAYNAGSIVYCRASSNADPGSGAKTRKAFMAYVNNETNPTSVEFQYVRSVSSKTDSQQGDQVFVYTLKNTSGGQWSVASRNMSPKINVSAPITKTFSNGANATITIGADAMTGATSGAAGAAGVVPKPNSGDQNKFLKGDGTWASIFDLIYPVGSIYMSVNNTDPGTLFGGTWTAWGAGRVPVGVDTNDTAFDTVEETGGEKTHTLTTTEIPSHSHGYLDYWSVQGGTGSNKAVSYDTTEGLSGQETAAVGGGGAHNNLQPYITCYMWKRTA